MIHVQRHSEFDKFIAGIKDQTTQGRIAARLARLMNGNPGDSESVGDGVIEIRIDFGPGWRIYYTKVGNQIVVLLGGGTKKQQQADIDAAKQRAKLYKQD